MAYAGEGSFGQSYRTDLSGEPRWLNDEPPVVASEAELLALPFVTLTGSIIEVGQSFRVNGTVTLTPGRHISVTAGGVVIGEAQNGQITGSVASPGHLIGTAQNDLRIEDMKLQNTGSGSVVSVTGESPAIVRCTITAALGSGVVLGAGVLDTDIVDCEFFCSASAHGIELTAQRPLLVEGCALSTGESLLTVTPSGTTLNQRLAGNRVFGSGALVHFQCGAASQITSEYLVASNNSIESGPIVKITSPAASTAYVYLYDISITGNKSQTTALIDSDLESTAAIGLDIFDGVISGNIVVNGSTGILFRQRRAATTRWKEIAVTGNNFEGGGMQIDAGSNYAETCTFNGNSLGDNYPLFVHSHPSNTSNSSSFGGNSFESGGKLLEVRYPGIGGGLVRTCTFDGNAMISGTLITVTGTVVNPILQNCAINGNIALTALSGASPFDGTTMGSNTEARGNYGQDDFGPGLGKLPGTNTSATNMTSITIAAGSGRVVTYSGQFKCDTASQFIISLNKVGGGKILSTDMLLRWSAQVNVSNNGSSSATTSIVGGSNDGWFGLGTIQYAANKYYPFTVTVHCPLHSNIWSVDARLVAENAGGQLHNVQLTMTWDNSAHPFEAFYFSNISGETPYYYVTSVQSSPAT